MSEQSMAITRDIAVKIVEAIIFTSDKPVSLRILKNRLPDYSDIDDIINYLIIKYKDGGFQLKKIGDTLAFRTSDDVSDFLTIEKTVQRKLSKAAMEILAIIAYHQPITRAEIEDMRGVSVSQGSLDVLFEANWVEPRGHKNVPGRPSTWRTTKNFLDHFDLESIRDLPGLSELKASGLLSRSMGASVLNRDDINNL